jgi:eukaryotic-like serine/threonine-protein kinase
MTDNPPQDDPHLAGNPFGGVPFGLPPGGGPPILVAGPPPRVPANSLATVSLILAFVFAPAGAVLAHLGLSQIKRTGQPGRGRAVAALVVSYTVIAVVVAGLVISAVHGSSPGSRVAVHGTTGAGAPPTQAPKGAAPAPTVAAADLEGLLPTATQLRSLAADPSLQLNVTINHFAALTGGGTPDRMECLGTISIGDPRVLDPGPVQGIYLTAYTDASGGKILLPSQAAMAYANAATAQTTVQGLLAKWRACSGTSFNVVYKGQSSSFSVGPVTDAGHGITALTVTAAGGVLAFDRAVAAKANVLVDVMITSKGSVGPVAISIANAVLDKIPG